MLTRLLVGQVQPALMTIWRIWSLDFVKSNFALLTLFLYCPLDQRPDHHWYQVDSNKMTPIIHISTSGWLKTVHHRDTSQDPLPWVTGTADACSIGVTQSLAHFFTALFHWCIWAWKLFFLGGSLYVQFQVNVMWRFWQKWVSEIFIIFSSFSCLISVCLPPQSVLT